MKDRYEYINQYVTSNYKMVEVKSGKMRWNYKCQLNAVHDAVNAEEKSIAMCVCLDEYNSPFIHFVNKTNGEYTDNTFGHFSKDYRYYLVREIISAEFNLIGNTFDSFRDFLMDLVPWYRKLFKKIRV